MFTTHTLIGMLLKPNVFIKQNLNILDNQKLRDYIKSNLKKHNVDTSKEINKLYKIIN